MGNRLITDLPIGNNEQDTGFEFPLVGDYRIPRRFTTLGLLDNAKSKDLTPLLQYVGSCKQYTTYCIIHSWRKLRENSRF